MTDRSELCETRSGQTIAHPQIKPCRRIVDKHTQLKLPQPACARPSMRHVEHVGARALAAMPFGNLYITDVQRVAFLGDAQHADRFVVHLENKILRLAPACEEQIPTPDEMMSLVVTAHVVTGKRFGKHEVIHARLAQQKGRRRELGRIEHGATDGMVVRTTVRQATRAGKGGLPEAGKGSEAGNEKRKKPAENSAGFFIWRSGRDSNPRPPA